MKKAFTIISAILFLISCENDETKKTSVTEKTTATNSADAAKGLELVTKSDCFTCHKLTETSIGPAYADIAAKYKILDEPAMDSMVKQIINGGAGRWGTVPMTPHPNMPKEDAQLMAHYIMSIKK
ncbi:MAG TPA: c-type cytochrome [Chitinophagaceae bacterium]|nr:c-type cytochrome [Chitinophagaceae bacterium]